MNSNQIVLELRQLLRKEIEELKKHQEWENLPEDHEDHIDGSWIYDMYRATDYLGRDIPWEEILRILS